MSDNQNLVRLLQSFLYSDGIEHYDSSCCWGCGELKTEECLPDCLLELTRRAVITAGVESCPQCKKLTFNRGHCWLCGAVDARIFSGSFRESYTATRR